MHQMRFSSRHLSWSLLLLSLSAHAGFDGNEGSDGQRGSDGRDGPSATIRADGSFQRLDLRGEDGDDGGSGSDGGSATCFSEDVQRGGDGGDGGRGGDGGAAGDLTVYFSDRAHLKNIYVLATPAEGGSGSFNYGRGGSGCGGGSDGNSGSYGASGDTGSSGDVYLVPQLEALPKLQSSVSIPLKELNSEGRLARHVWKRYSGGRSLFAQGSDMSDIYSLWEGVDERSYELVWASSNSKTAYGNAAVSLSLHSDGFYFSTPRELWMKTTSKTEGTHTVLRVESVLREADATSLSSEGFVGAGAGFRLGIKDAKSLSKLVASKVSMTFRISNIFGVHVVRFSGEVPRGALEISSSRIRINPNKLGIDPKHFKKGRYAVAEVRVTRSFAERESTVSVKVDGKIP